MEVGGILTPPRRWQTVSDRWAFQVSEALRDPWHRSGGSLPGLGPVPFMLLSQAPAVNPLVLFLGVRLFGSGCTSVCFSQWRGGGSGGPCRMAFPLDSLLCREEVAGSNLHFHIL